MDAPVPSILGEQLCGRCGYALRGLAAVEGVVRCPECGVVAGPALAGPPGLGLIVTFGAWSCLTIILCASVLIRKGLDAGFDRYGVMTRDIYELALFTAPLAPLALGEWLAGVDVEPRTQRRIFWRSMLHGTVVNLLLLGVSVLIEPPGPFSLAA